MIVANPFVVKTFPAIEVSRRFITPANEGFLIGFFEFLANVRYDKADLFLKNLLVKSLNVLDTYTFNGYEGSHKTKEEVKVELLCKVSRHIVHIFDNENVTNQTHAILI